MNIAPRVAGLAATVLLVAASAACQSSPQPANEAESIFAGEIDVALAEARDANASPEQIATLEEIADTLIVTYEQAKVAAVATVDCVLEAGGYGNYSESTLAPGVPLPGFGIGSGTTDAEGNDQVADRCIDQESMWVNMLYQTQPTVVAQVDAHRAAQLPEFIACVEDKGLEVPADADGDEVFKIALENLDSNTAPCFEVGGYT